MTCCLCRRRLRNDEAVHELRRDGLARGRPRVYHYCRRCWAESRNDECLRRLQVTRGHSTLAAEATVDTRTPWEEGIA